jgi:hypothetical protein
MSVKDINSVLARCLVDAKFFHDLQKHPEDTLTSSGLGRVERAAFREMDLAALRQFVGFVIKVQNNHLYSSFPITRKLLSYYGLDHEVFLGFHSHHQQLRSRSGTSRAIKTKAFMTYFQDYLTQLSGIEFLVLSNCFTNESLLLKVQQAWEKLQNDRIGEGTTPLATPSLTVDEIKLYSHAQFLQFVVNVNPSFHQHEFSLDPNILTEITQRSCADIISQLSFEAHWLGYWIPYTENGYRQLKLTPLTSALVDAGCSGRTVKEIIESLEETLGESLDQQSVVSFWRSALQAGLVTLHPFTA